jgi:CMP-N,N'-diacetyllegionaminic acid synthase
MDAIGLITARGGSKGIPRKNVRPLAGKPLIAWSIEAALASRLSHVVVSTDDEEIAEVSRSHGAEVPFLRPAALAGDTSPHVDVVLHALDWCADGSGREPEWLMLLQPTAPARTAEDIDAALDLAESSGASAVVSVVETAHHPYIAKRMDEAGRLSDFLEVDLPYRRRQDFPPCYVLNGAIYVMPEERSLDVDTPWDFHVADLIVRDRLANGTVKGSGTVSFGAVSGEMNVEGSETVPDPEHLEGNGHVLRESA